MPARERLDSWKEGFRDLLRIGSPRARATSLPNTRQPSPSPRSPNLLRSVTPLPGAAVSSAQDDAGSHLLSPSTDTVPSQVIATATSSVPLGLVLDPKPAAPAPVVPPKTTQTTSSNEGTSEERVKSMVWPGLKALLKVVDASADVFPPLKSAVGGLNQCIEIFESASKGHKDHGGLRSKLDSLLEDLSHHLDGPAGITISTSMKRLSNGLHEEVKLVQQKYGRSTVRRHAEALEDADEIIDCHRRIQGHLERLTLNANMSTWRIVDEQATELRLRQLSPTLSAVYNSAESEDVQRKPCTHGTREQELTRLLNWARNKDAGDVYWMNGMTGTGKTTLAYSVCDLLSQNMELGASFFCSRLIPECRDVKLILPAIAYQLARFSHPFRYALSRVLEADPDVHTRVLKTQFESLLVKPLSVVMNTLPADLVVVIDALDECANENSMGQILDILLAQTGSNDLPIRFLISSRPEPEIYPRMMTRVGQDFKTRLVLHDLDAETVKHDIKIYLQNELKDIHLTPPQLASLVERSGVLFIYASTAARYIKAGLRFKDHERRLKMILELSSPPMNSKDRGIDALYKSILDVAFQNEDLDEPNQKLMKTILDTVICAQEPMSVGGLAGLLGSLSGQEVDAMLRPLGSVLNISETNGVVTTLHASFPDFMLNQDRSSEFYCNQEQNHARLATACFEVIKKNDPQFDICSLGSSYLRDNEVDDLTKQVDQAVTPELFYACRYWISHLEFGDPLSKIRELLYDFLSFRLLLWIEVLNVKQSMRYGPSIIRRAEIWSRAHDCSNEMTELAHDAWCFVTMFTSHAVSQSTPHLYVSMLPLWSDTAPISTHYTKRMQGAIKAQGTAMSRRQLALLATWSFNDTVHSTRFSPDDSLIAFGISSSVYVIDATTGRTVVGPLEHEDSVTSVAFSPDGTLIASGSKDKTIRVWSIQNKQIIVGPLAEHTDTVQSVSFSPDSTRIVSGSADKSIRVWDTHSGKTLLVPLGGDSNAGYSVCFSPDGTCMTSGGRGGTLRLSGAQSGELISDWDTEDNEITSVCFSPDGTRIAFSSFDEDWLDEDDDRSNIWVRSANGCQQIAGPFEGIGCKIWTVAFSPDGELLATGSDDETIRLWDLTSDPISSRILEGHTAPVTSVAFSSDGSRIVSCSDDNTIRVWDARSRATVADSLEAHTETVYSVGYSPDGKHIVSGSGDQTIRMWDAESGQTVGGPLEGHTDEVNSVCFSPDGRRIVSGSDDETIRAWDVESGQTVVGPLEGHTGQVLSICHSPDGVLIASGSVDKTIRVWDARDGNAAGSPFEGHDGYVRSVCFSPDSARIASGSDDKTIMVWDAKSGRNVAGPLEGHTNWVLSVCFSPDGTRLVSGSEDKAVRVWDAQGGQTILGPLEGHTGGINSICFSPNGSLIVSGSDDQTVRLWDARSGQAVGDPLVGHTGRVWSVAFSPDGKHIVSGSEDQTIRVWDVDGLLRMYGAADSLPSPGPVPISPPRPHESWVLRDDGWVVDREARLLVWVPPDLQPHLLRSIDWLIIRPQGYVRIGFDDVKLGESWVECYQPPSS